ncbi:MAG: AAA family ATPase, partial [Alphaproteobacteria bacterium]
IKDIIGVPPWDAINDQFKKYNFKYEINRPKESQSRYEVKFTLISNPDNNVHFSNLSSGEQMIVMLILWSFNEELAQVKKLLLLDEPDAHLHPEMGLMFKEIISEIIVKKFGVQVIMTTHSPTTLCWFEEENIFLMDKYKGIIKSNKQEAMSKLTSGLVFVHQNFKIVVVEDEDDRKFYQKIFDNLLLNNFLSKTDRLVFRSVNSKKEGGGKTKVIEIGRQWKELSVNTEIANLICGLVDKDNDSNEDLPQNVKVLSSYCFENFLADPLLIFALLVQEGEPSITKFSHDKIGYQHGEEYRFKNGEIREAQKIINFILEKLLQNAECNITQEPFQNKKSIEYINGLSVELPEMLLTESGKDKILSLYKKAFASKASNINKNTLTDMMIKTHLIPKDLVDIYRQLLN